MSYLLPNYKACNLYCTFSRLIRVCDVGDELSINEFLYQLSIRYVTLVHVSFYILLLYMAVCRNASAMYNASYLFLLASHVCLLEIYTFVNLFDKRNDPSQEDT